MKKMILLLVSLLLLYMPVYAQQNIEITYWTHEDPNRTEIENRYIEEFEAANPGVTINRVTNPSNRMAEIVLTAFAANQGPDMFKHRGRFSV
jgi:multiple sugar transport system substrate-binding protein